MPDIHPIDAMTWSFEEGGVRFFLLNGRERALLIDSGMETRNARELAEGLTDLPLELLNTHADRDHIGSNGEFERVYMSPAEAVNYYKGNGGTGEIAPLWDGDVLDLGDRPLRIVALPGHTPGSIAVLDVKYRRLFSGDPVQTGRIFMFGPQREMHAYIHSLKRLEAMSSKFDRIYPSHAACPVLPTIIPQLISAAEAIVAGHAEGKTETGFGRPIRAYDMGVAAFLCDPA